MQLNEYPYDDPGLAGLGKSLKKLGKKLKKIVKPALHIGAAVFTGGSSLALSASMLKAKADRKSQEKMQKAMIAAQAAPFEPITQLAPTANSVASRLPMPTYATENSFAPSGGGGGGGWFPSEQPMQQAQQPATPAWVMPAAIAGGAVVLMTLMNSRRQP